MSVIGETAAGLAIGGVSLLAALAGAVDGYLLVSDLISPHDDVHWLAVRYDNEKHRLDCWRSELVRRSGGDPSNALRTLLRRDEVFIDNVITDILATHRELNNLIEKHGVKAAQLPAANGKRSSAVADAEARNKVKIHNRVSWIVKNKDAFKEKVEKLEKANNMLFERMGYDRSIVAAITLSALTVPNAQRQAELIWLQRSQNPFVSQCAAIKLLEMSPGTTAVHRIQFTALTLDDAQGSRSMASYTMSEKTSLRVLVEWKSISQQLPVEDQARVVTRIQELGQLLCSKKQTEFRVPDCLGICADPDTARKRHGYVYGLPSEESDKLSMPSTLTQLLQPDFDRETGEEKYKTALLGSRFELARTLAYSFSLLHASKWLHKGFRSNNILFCRKWDDADHKLPLTDLYVAGFEYSRPERPGEPSIETQVETGDVDIDLYRHPDAAKGFRKEHDVYSLGVVLFEIALWRPLKSKFLTNPAQMTAQDRKDYLLASVPLLGGAVGGTYRDVVKRCLSGHLADDGLLSGDDPKFARAFQFNVVHALENCKA